MPFESGKVVIHPSAVDFITSERAEVLRHVELPLDLTARDHVEAAVAMRERILDLKATRDSASRAIFLGGASTADLRPSSAQALSLMDHMAQVAGDAGLAPVHYGLSDVRSTKPEHHSAILRETRNGWPFYTRPEEGLTEQAADIAHEIKERIEVGKIPDARMRDPQTVERVARDGAAQFSLYGYTFRHNSADAGSQVRFPDFPSCEPFLAATVLEQLSLGEAVVRIVPRTFKKKEYAARWILEQLGHSDLPVVSVAVGDEGSINKVIRWSQVPNTIPAELGDVIRQVRESRRTNTSVTS